MDKSNAFIRKFARFAFASAITFVAIAFLAAFFGYGSRRIATMKFVRLAIVFGLGASAILGFVCLLIMILKGVLLANKGAVVRSVVAILLGSLLIGLHVQTWDTEFGRTEAANRAVCATNLKTIETAMYRYADDHDGKYPPQENWKEVLIEEGHIGKKDMECFICPSIGGNAQKECSYIYRGPASTGTPGGWIVLYERKHNHSYLAPGGRNVVCGAHGVHFMTEEEFQEAIRKENAQRKQMGLPIIPAQD